MEIKENSTPQIPANFVKEITLTKPVINHRMEFALNYKNYKRKYKTANLLNALVLSIPNHPIYRKH